MVRCSLRCGRRSRRRGLASLEFAIVLPMFLVMLMGVWEIARMVELKRVLQSAAREGARQASNGVMTNAQVVDAIKLFLKVSLNDADPTGVKGQTIANAATISVANLTQPGVDATNAAQLDEFKVSVELPYSAARWTATDFFTNSSTKISADCYQRSMKDKGYPSATTPAIE